MKGSLAIRLVCAALREVSDRVCPSYCDGQDPVTREELYAALRDVADSFEREMHKILNEGKDS